MQLTRENDWPGLGTEEDKIIIDSFKGFPKRIQIFKNHLFVEFRDCTFPQALFLTYCSNFTFKRCKFYYLGLDACDSLHLSKCKIPSLWTRMNVRDCIFNKNQMTEESCKCLLDNNELVQSIGDAFVATKKLVVMMAFMAPFIAFLTFGINLFTIFLVGITFFLACCMVISSKSVKKNLIQTS